MRTGLRSSISCCSRLTATSILLALLALCACPRPSHAQDDEASAPPAQLPLRARASLAVSTMVSRDQIGWLGYDSFGALTNAQLGYALRPWLEAQFGFTFAGFGSAPRGTGLLIAPNVGVLLGPTLWGMRPYLQLDVGPGFTGSLLRVYLRASTGIDFRISRALMLGPQLGYAHLFQKDGPGATTDARFPWLGISLSFRPASAGQSELPTRTKTVTNMREVFVYRHLPASPDPREPESEQAPPPEVRPPSRALIELIDRAVSVEQEELLAPVLFQFDSAALEPTGVATLHEVARELIRRRDIARLEIVGYADRRGSLEYNRELSYRRAQSVRTWLMAHGIASQRMQVAPKGATEFVEAGDEEQAHEQNRRVVFRVLQSDKEAKP